MTSVRVDLMISLDGYATTTDQTPDDPFGKDWGRLTAAYAATRTFRARVLHDTTGGGTTGADEEFAARYFENIGAEIMGAGMFGLHAHPDDPDWRGWWGEEPPFGCPVFVLTHSAPRPDIVFPNGTRFQFLDASPEEALAHAVDAASGKDVRVGGGPTTVQSFLKAGLVDELRVAVVPILLGQGIRLWEGLRGLEHGMRVNTVVSDSGVSYVTLTREAAR
jgi:dihydrofolate reductase